MIAMQFAEGSRRHQLLDSVSQARGECGMAIGTAILILGILYLAVVSEGFRKLLLGLIVLSVVGCLALFMQVEYRTFYDPDLHKKPWEKDWGRILTDELKAKGFVIDPPPKAAIAKAPNVFDQFDERPISSLSNDELIELYLSKLSDSEVIEFCTKNKVCPNKLKSGRITDPEILKQLYAK
jgi:hypothetical protein